MVLSNNDKQIRFRRKEELKKKANLILRDWQFRGWNHLGSRSIEDIKKTLDELVDLKPNWTEEDYNSALKALDAFQLELYDNPHSLENDVYRARDNIENLRTTNDSAKLFAEQKKAVQNMKNLSAHIISAINLAGGIASDNAAAIMEVFRFVGHSLVKEAKIPRSQATAMCLAILGSQYEKPEWLFEELGKLLVNQMGVDDVDLLIRAMENYKKEFEEF